MFTLCGFAFNFLFRSQVLFHGFFFCSMSSRGLQLAEDLQFNSLLRYVIDSQSIQIRLFLFIFVNVLFSDILSDSCSLTNASQSVSLKEESESET